MSVITKSEVEYLLDWKGLHKAVVILGAQAGELPRAAKIGREKIKINKNQ